MKKTLLISLLIIFFSFHSALGKPVKPEKALKAANTFLKVEKLREQNKLIKFVSKKVQKKVNLSKLNVGDIREIRGDDGRVLAYVTELEPEGYIIAIAEYGVEIVANRVIQGLMEKGMAKEEIIKKLDNYWFLSNSLKKKLKNMVKDYQVDNEDGEPVHSA